jgi:hypothetical protein
VKRWRMRADGSTITLVKAPFRVHEAFLSEPGKRYIRSSMSTVSEAVSGHDMTHFLEAIHVLRGQVRFHRQSCRRDFSEHGSFRARILHRRLARFPRFEVTQNSSDPSHSRDSGARERWPRLVGAATWGGERFTRCH